MHLEVCPVLWFRPVQACLGLQRWARVSTPLGVWPPCFSLRKHTRTQNTHTHTQPWCTGHRLKSEVAKCATAGLCVEVWSALCTAALISLISFHILRRTMVEVQLVSAGQARADSESKDKERWLGSRRSLPRSFTGVGTQDSRHDIDCCQWVMCPCVAIYDPSRP